MVVMTETRTLGMNNNLIKTINGLGHILDEVMWASNKLLWIDLSHNHLTNIDEDIAQSFKVFDIDVPYVWVLFILNVFTNPAFIYFFSFLFDKDETGSLVIKMIYIVIGIIGPITMSIL